jgi:hypothetical protein
VTVQQSATRIGACRGHFSRLPSLLLPLLLLLPGYVAPGDRFKGLPTIELQVVSELVSRGYGWLAS